MSLPENAAHRERIGRQPLYAQVRDRISAAIEAGEWEAGDALPSEFELADRFGVSQGTVRKGLDDLVEAGVLRRRQGAGTFVTEASEDWGSAAALGDDRPLESSVELLACTRANAGDEAAALGLRRGASLFVVKRLARVLGGPFAVIESAVSAERFDGLDARRIRQAHSNLRTVWWRDFGLRVLPGPPTLRACRAGREEARLLGVEEGAALLEVTRVGKGMDGVPVEWSVVRCCTESYAYRI